MPASVDDSLAGLAEHCSATCPYILPSSATTGRSLPRRHTSGQSAGDPQQIRHPVVRHYTTSIGYEMTDSSNAFATPLPGHHNGLRNAMFLTRIRDQISH